MKHAKALIQPVITTNELLFSYGTLQIESVQLATYGRLLNGTPDVLTGYVVRTFEIDDELVVAVSGLTQHTMASFTGLASDEISGTVFALTTQELANTDDYEVDAVTRVMVELRSGARAWAYVDTEHPGKVAEQTDDDGASL